MFIIIYKRSVLFKNVITEVICGLVIYDWTYEIVMIACCMSVHDNILNVWVDCSGDCGYVQLERQTFRFYIK